MLSAMLNNLTRRQRIGLWLVAMTVLAVEIAEFAAILARLFWAHK